MDRKDFLNKFTGGLALTCVSCMMAACSKEENNGAGNGNGNGNGTGNPILTLDLSTQIPEVGDFIASNGVIVIRTATGNQSSSFKAFSNVCPHEAGTITYNKTTTVFTCGKHGATFNQTGAVTKGPASSNMSTKAVNVTGSILTV